MSSLVPYTASIPSTPDSKLYNILSFSGLSCNENPFASKPGSAADILNLYLNEENTLAVRPRLDLIRSSPSNLPIKQVIKKEDSVLFIAKAFGDPKIDIFKGFYDGDNFVFDKTVNSVELDSDKFTFFYDDNEQLFVTSDIGLYVYDEQNPNLRDFKSSGLAYIPTVKSGAFLDNISAAIDYEEYNIWTDKYKIKYFFDPVEPIGEVSGKLDFSEVYSTKSKDLSEYEVLLSDYDGDLLLKKDLTYELFDAQDGEIKYITADLSQFTISGDLTTLNNTKKVTILKNKRLYSIEFELDEKLLNITQTQNLIETSSTQTSTIFNENLPEQLKTATDLIGLNALISSDGSIIAGMILYDFDNNKVWPVVVNASTRQWLIGNEQNNFLPITMNSLGTYLKNLALNVTDNRIVMVSDSAYFYNSNDERNAYKALHIDWWETEEDGTMAYYNTKFYPETYHSSSYFRFIQSDALITLGKDIYLLLSDYTRTRMAVKLDEYDFKIIRLTDSNEILPIPNSHNYFERSEKDSSPVFKLKSVEQQGVALDVSDLFKGQDETFLSKSYASYNFTTNKKQYLYNADNQILPLLSTLNSRSDHKEIKWTFSEVYRFNNRLWFYDDSDVKNLLIYTSGESVEYIPETFSQRVGDSGSITSLLQLSDSILGIFKKESTTIATPLEDDLNTYAFESLKTELGNVPKGQAIVTALSSQPLVINEYGVFSIGQSNNTVNADSVYSCVSDAIELRYKKIKNKDRIKTHNHGFLTYLYTNNDYGSEMWVYDNRTKDWFYWTFPVQIDAIFDQEWKTEDGTEVASFIWSGKKLYRLTEESYYQNNWEENNAKDNLLTYQDRLTPTTFRRIPWYWKSHPLTLNIINYLKKLTELGLVFADEDRSLKYSVKDLKYTLGSFGEEQQLQLFYRIKTYRKKSQLLNSSYKGQLDYVRTIRIKPRVQKFDFLTLELTNRLEDEHGNLVYTYGNSGEENYGYGILDKLNLIGLTFKTTLSTGS